VSNEESLAEAKDRFLRGLKATARGAECPCCGRVGRIYKRSIHATMVRILIRLYTLGGDRDWVSIQTLFPSITHRGGEWSRTKLWGLIESGSRGDWRLTSEGVEFVLDRLKVPRRVHVWNNEVIGFDGEMVGAREVVNEHFSYDALMRQGEKR
jgi:hypothetical protein